MISWLNTYVAVIAQIIGNLSLAIILLALSFGFSASLLIVCLLWWTGFFMVVVPSKNIKFCKKK